MIGDEQVIGIARHFLILRELGRGGMGIVYRAFDPALKRFVAIKTTQNDPDRIAWLKREALASSNLRHPNIIEVYGFDPDHTPPFFVMEYVEGRSLESLIKDEGPLPWKKAVKFGATIARALEYAHGQKVIHRDIKPANVLVSKDSKLKLMDFGLAYEELLPNLPILEMLWELPLMFLLNWLRLAMMKKCFMILNWTFTVLALCCMRWLLANRLLRVRLQ
jgi:serine/threonine protein kinase